MSSAHAGPQQWILPTVDSTEVTLLAEQLQCPQAIAQLLLARGVADHTAAQAFLNPSIDDLHDPMLLLGMDRAVARIQQAVRCNEPIPIYGDYAVDGTTAPVLLKPAIERIAAKEPPAIVTYH